MLPGMRPSRVFHRFSTTYSRANAEASGVQLRPSRTSTLARITSFRIVVQIPGLLHQRGLSRAGGSWPQASPHPAVSSFWCIGAFPGHGFRFCSGVYSGTSFRSASSSWPQASRHRAQARCVDCSRDLGRRQASRLACRRAVGMSWRVSMAPQAPRGWWAGAPFSPCAALACWRGSGMRVGMETSTALTYWEWQPKSHVPSTVIRLAAALATRYPPQQGPLTWSSSCSGSPERIGSYQRGLNSCSATASNSFSHAPGKLNCPFP